MGEDAHPTAISAATLPLLKVVAASLGRKGSIMPLLLAAPVESMIAAPIRRP